MLTLTNSSPYATSYTLLAEENAWPLAFSPAVTPSLGPGQMTTVQMTVRPPAGTAAVQDRRFGQCAIGP